MFCLKARSLYFVLHLLIACRYISASANSNDTKINIREQEIQLLDQILTTYDARIRPSGISGTDGPVIVRVGLYVRSISNVDDANMEFSLQVTLRKQWVDERLKFDDIAGTVKYLPLTETNRIWKPDLFFRNEKKSHFHNTLMPNVLVRIYPNGAVQYSIRISLTLSCPMDLRRYPFDRRHCLLQMSSYGSTAADLVFLWKENDAVEVSRNSIMARFTYEKHLTDYCSQKSTGPEYPCLTVTFAFSRSLSDYTIRIYIPCSILVLASFVSFWLDPEAVTARVLLGVATLVTMAVEISIISATMPVVPYMKAIDVWTGVCLMFIFGTLLEFATVSYTSRIAKKKQCDQANVEEISNLNHDASREPSKTLAKHCKWLSTCSTSKKFDIVSRIVFPITFGLFNLAYWWVYLTPRDY